MVGSGARHLKLTITPPPGSSPSRSHASSGDDDSWPSAFFKNRGIDLVEIPDSEEEGECVHVEKVIAIMSYFYFYYSSV
jgi:hypothetical protein